MAKSIPSQLNSSQGNLLDTWWAVSSRISTYIERFRMKLTTNGNVRLYHMTKSSVYLLCAIDYFTQE